MSQAFEFPLEVQSDGKLVAKPDAKRVVDLSQVSFVVDLQHERPRLVMRSRQPFVERIRTPTQSDKNLYIDELRRAEKALSYVGLGYFLTHWKSPKLPFGVDNRRPVIDALVAEGVVEVYVAHNGKDALRVVR